MALEGTAGNSKMYGITLLNESNYQTWKTKIEALLKREGTWRAVTTERPTDEADIEQWETRDEKAQGTICLFIEDDQNSHIEGKSTSNEMWEALKEYHEKGSGGTKYMLVTELFSQKLSEGGDLEKHIGKIQSI